MASVNAERSWVVIDSHLWVDYFQGSKDPFAKEVDRLIVAKRPCLIGPIMYEVLIGPKHEGQKQYMEGRFRRLPCLATTEPVWHLAIDLGRSSSVRGIQDFPVSDIHIAAHCIVYACALFTRDVHFDVIGALKRHRL